MAARVVALASVAALGAPAPAARAEPSSDAALIWQAPDSCPDAGEVRARIERRLGAPVERVVRGVAVDVAIQRDGRGPRYVARIDLRGLRGTGSANGTARRIAASGANGARGSSGSSAADGAIGARGSSAVDGAIRARESSAADGAIGARGSSAASGAIGARSGATDSEIRVLTSARCDELTDAVAVVIARIAAEAGPVAGELRAERAAVVPAVPVAPQAWGAGLRMLGLSGIGAMPGVSVGGEVSGYVRARWLVAELVGMSWLRSASVVHLGAPARIDVSLALAALRLGWGPEHLPLRAWLGGEIGALRGAGVALDDPQVAAGRWIAVGTGFAVAWPMFTHARLVGAIELSVPLSRPRFVLPDGSEVYRPGPVAVRSGLGLEVGWR